MLYQISFWLKNFLGKLSHEEGQGLIEYALILVFIAIVVIVILTAFGEPLRGIYCQVLDAINGTAALPATCPAVVVPVT